MNEHALLTIVIWKTINKRKGSKAVTLAKNYALVNLQPSLYIGRLTKKERGEFEAKMNALLSGKRDQVHFFTACRSCALESNASHHIARQYQTTIFEIV
jgi:CRISPR/Cas system-associated endoribonuclease Cas2